MPKAKSETTGAAPAATNTATASMNATAAAPLTIHEALDASVGAVLPRLFGLVSQRRDDKVGTKKTDKTTLTLFQHMEAKESITVFMWGIAAAEIQPGVMVELTDIAVSEYKEQRQYQAKSVKVAANV